MTADPSSPRVRRTAAACLLIAPAVFAQASEKEQPATLAAMRDLRLIASVQLTYHQANKRFASPQQLKDARFLDPLWPRAPEREYRIECSLPPDRAVFVCHADAIAPDSVQRPFLRIDHTQVMRFETGKRAHAASPALRSTLSRASPEFRKEKK